MAQRNGLRTLNRRGALLLGATLAAVLAVALIISLRIYAQLGRAQRSQIELFDAQRRLDVILRVQLDEETGLRGYLATGRSALFLEPYVERADTFESAADGFAASIRQLGDTQAPALLRDVRTLHGRWKREVAEPLLANPRAGKALWRQTLGKSFVDRVRRDVARLQELLSGRLALVQTELRARIDEALVAGLASVVVFGGLSIGFVLSRAQMIAAIAREREIVDTLQRAFRTRPDDLAGTRIGTAYLSADRDAAVGGDLYDVRRLDASRGLVLVADISGKGIQAAVNTAFVKYAVRTLAVTYDDPGVILAHFNRMFLSTVEDQNLFVVAFVAVVDTVRGTLRYASAGHSTAYVRRGDAVVQLEVTGPIVGLDANVTYESRTWPLCAGDVVLLATDGLTEARADDGSFLDDAGAMALLRTASREPQACADELAGHVSRMNRGAVSDDLALVVIAIDAAGAKAA